jgi:hypothetical protein
MEFHRAPAVGPLDEIGRIEVVALVADEAE